MNDHFYLKNKEKKSGSLVLKNARIIDPSTSLDKIGTILIRDGLIFDIKFSDTTEYEVNQDFIWEEIIDCKSMIAIPGIIDIHVHFREPFDTDDSGSIKTESKMAAKSGITTVVCQPNTMPPIDNNSVVEYINQIANQYSYIDIKMFCAITQGRNGLKINNLDALSKLKNVVGFSDDGSCVMNGRIMQSALEYSTYINMPIAQHAEDYNIANGGCFNAGHASFNFGCRGISPIAESSIVARDLAIAKNIPGSKYHAQHISSKSSLELIEDAKNRGQNITVEVTPHHILLNENDIVNENGKINPPIKTPEDQNAILNHIYNGVIDCIATDHAPHCTKRKCNTTIEKAAFGTTGLEALLPTALKLYHDKIIPLNRAIELITSNPAKIINQFGEIGTIKKGARANIALIDINLQWEFNETQTESKSHNSVFLNKRFKGKVLKTIVGGKLIYEYKE